MLYYLLFWTLLGFIIHFYIIFGTNLSTGGPAQNCCFLHIPGDLNPTSSNQQGSHEVGGAPTPQARSPPLWAPCCSTDVLLPPIYTYVPPNGRIWSQNPNSTAVTFCIHETHLEACSGAPPEGASITEGFYINTIATPMKCE